MTGLKELYLELEPYKDMSIDELVYELNTASAQKFYRERLEALKVELIEEIIKEVSVPNYLEVWNVNYNCNRISLGNILRCFLFDYNYNDW